MTEETCAACDCKIEAEAIKVTVGGRTVEVCCDECARVLGEAYAPTSSSAGHESVGNEPIEAIRT